MDIKKEKFIGEAPLKGDPTKKLILTIKDGSVTTSKIADRAVTPEKLSNRVKTEVVKPLVDAAKDDLQNQIDSLEVSGIALSQEFGNNPNIGISQKVLTERFEELDKAISHFHPALRRGDFCFVIIAKALVNPETSFTCFLIFLMSYLNFCKNGK